MTVRSSLSTKLVLAMFLNTCVVPCAIQVVLVVLGGPQTCFDQDFLFYIVFANGVSAGFISPITTYLFSVGSVINSIKLKCLAKGWINATQREALKWAEPPAIDMSYRYANATLLLLMGFFFSPLFPSFSILIFGGLLF